MNTDEHRLWKEINRRDAELSSGKVMGLSHQQVMRAARQSLLEVTRDKIKAGRNIPKPKNRPT